MLRTSLRFLLTLLLALGLTACDSDSDDDGGGGNNTFGSGNVSISGAVTASFSGDALYVAAQDVNGTTGYVIYIVDGDFTAGQTTGFRALYVGGEGTLTEGQTTLGEDADDGAAYYDGSSQSTFAGVSATSGTLTITSISDDEVRGSVTFSGIYFDTADPQQQGTAQVTASFTASRYTGGAVPVPTLP